MKVLPHLIPLILPQKPVIDEDGPHLDSSLLQENCQHGAVHSTAHTAHNLLFANSLPDLFQKFTLEILDTEFLQRVGP